MKNPEITRKINALRKGKTLEKLFGEDKAKKLKEACRIRMLNNECAKGVKFTDKRRQEYSEMFAGKKNPMFGKTHSDEIKSRMVDTWFEKGQIPWNKGFGEYIEGEKNPRWLGGVSFEPYSEEFNDRLKKTIRQRDNYTCMACRITEKELSRVLSIHHIDFNKQNNSPDNLISLCNKCHAQITYKRSMIVCLS